MKKFIFVSVMVLFGYIQANASEPTACTMDYTPVCGSIQVQCFTTPCNPIRETFSNTCMAKAANAKDLSLGECVSSIATPIVGGDKDIHGCIGSAGYSWSTAENKCIRPWEVSKMTPRQALQMGTWQLESFNNNPVNSSGTITFSKNNFSAKICNNLNGQYGTFAGALIFRKVMSTRMYCDGDIMAVEDAMNFARSKFMVGDYNLTITTKKGDVIVWKKVTL